MATDYPGDIDSLPRPTAATAMNAAGFEGDVVIDNLSDAVEAIETELGTDPAGAYATVAARITAIEAQSINAQTGTTYTVALSDVGKIVTLSNTGAITVTLPQDSSVAVPVGGRVDFVVISTGMATFAQDAGSTVNGTPSLATRAQWSAATAIKRAANTWVVVGDLA